MHEAQQYLLNPDNPPSLYVIIGGKRRRLFINRPQNEIGIIAPRKKKSGYIFYQWDSIEKVCYPTERTVVSEEEKNSRLVRKYQRLAAQATFSSPYLRKVENADKSKGLYENHLTSGTAIDGNVISLNAVEKWCGRFVMDMFRQAIKECRRFDSGRFDFRGYDGSLWVEPCAETEDGYQKGDLRAGLCKEYRGCGNGYYYILINDDNFIGYDID